MYDEHGGLWDHVVPPAIDNWGPGLRVPLEIVSPFAKNGFVDHTQYETVSLLKFLEGLYRLPPLNTRDDAALAPISPFRGQPDLVVKATAGKPFLYRVPAYNDPQFFFVLGNLDGIETDPSNGTFSAFRGVQETSRLWFWWQVNKGPPSLRFDCRSNRPANQGRQLCHIS